MGRVAKAVQSSDLQIEGQPPTRARRRGNLAEQAPEPVLTHHDAPVQRVRRVAAKDAPAAAPTTVISTGYVTIQVEENENIPNTGLFLGLNGRGYLLKPGVPCPVPPGILEVLNNAVEKMAVVDPQTRQITGHRDRLRYPYRVVS